VWLWASEERARPCTVFQRGNSNRGVAPGCDTSAFQALLNSANFSVGSMEIMVQSRHLLDNIFFKKKYYFNKYGIIKTLWEG